jgi:hypothetical protein
VLDGNSDGIDPLAEDVTIGLDGFSLTIDAGSFHRRGRRNYKFNGVIDGVRISADLKAPHSRGKWKKGHAHRAWTFKFKGKNADLSSVEKPVDTLLKIGDDIGEGPGPRKTRVKG